MAERRLSLRGGLILSSVLVIVLIGVGIGAGAVLSLRQTLLADLDAELAGLADTAVGGPGGMEAEGPGDPHRILDRPGLGDGSVAVAVADDAAVGVIASAGESIPLGLDAAQTQVIAEASAQSGPTTVEVPDLGPYRVLAVADGAATYVFGVPQSGVERVLGYTGTSIGALVLAGVIAAAGVMSVLISRRLAPLAEVARTATEVAGLDLESGESSLRTRVPDRLSTPGTEVGDVGAAMNQMLDHVDEALQARYASEQQVRRFVADASHELRTPLATVRGYAELTKPLREQMPEQAATALERIDAGAARMSGLVEDLLLLARLDAGREPAEEAVVDLSALLIELVGDAHVTGPEHRFALDLPEEPVLAVGSEQRIGQVLLNIMGNAVAHTPAGTRVSVAARTVGRTVEVTIADDGPGIDPEIADRVFERFVRADVGRSRTDDAQRAGGSSGLGLSIARSLTELMGGTVGLRSSPEGTTVTVELTAAT